MQKILPKTIIQPFANHAYWALEIFPQWTETFHNVETVLTLLAKPEKILQETRRGVVSLIRYQNVLFIAKRSKTQEQRWWDQFTSLYRRGEGARTLRNMAKLYALGLPVPEPVLILEKKQYGFVVTSWSMYRYLEGQPCTCADAPQIAKMLQRIHHKGWVHRDPHVKNFLLNDNDMCIIDCARARPWRSRYARMYDVVLLNNCCPGSSECYGISETYWMYRLAKCHNNLIKFWRRVKRWFRPKAYRNRE